ncbi:MAG: hypothetical protein ABIU09_00245 [Pyrinomonadaceae bacterium]
MRNLKKFTVIAAFVSAMIFAGAADISAQVRKRPVIKKKVTTIRRPVAPKLFTVQSGKKIRVRMNDTISSKTARVGDRFTVTVTEPVYSTGGVIVIPTGSELVGRIDAVKAARKGGNVGELDASFVQVVLPNGAKRAINGSLTELVSDDAKSDPEGTASGDKTRHRKVKFIGGGAGGGALLGAIAGGGRGALIGGIIGGVGGLIAETQTKGEEAEVKSGTEFGVYLNQSISMPKFMEVNP